MDSADETGVSRVQLWLTLDGRNSVTRHFSTSFGGRFQFRNLPAGTYTLNVYTQRSSNGRPVYKTPDYGSRKIVIAESDSVVSDYRVELERNPTGSSVLSGQIWDKTINQAVPGAFVYLYSSELEYSLTRRTNSQGVWSAPNLPEGVYSVSYGFREEQRVFVVPDPEFVTIDGDNSEDIGRVEVESLSSTGSSLRVTLRDRETHLPIPNAYVSINSNGLSSGWGDGRTNPLGEIDFSQLFPATYQVYVWADGFFAPTEQLTVTIEEGQNTLGVRLESVDKTASVRGTVIDAWGNPMQNAKVAATMEIRSQEWGGDYIYTSTLTDSSGNYELTGVPAGRSVDLSVMIPGRESKTGGFAPYLERIELSTGESITRDVTLRPAAVISGQIEGNEGQSLRWLQVQLLDYETKAWRGAAQINEEGIFVLGNLPEGEYALFVSDNRWNTSSARMQFGYYSETDGGSLVPNVSSATKLTVQEGQTRSLPKVTMDKGQEVTGEVSIEIDGQLSSYFHRWIEISIERQSDPGAWETYTGLNHYYASGYEGGRFKVDGLPAGTYRLTFSEPWASGTKLGTFVSNPIEVPASGAVEALEILMSISKPSADPQFQSLQSLTAEEQAALQDKISTDTSDVSSGTSDIQVGMEYVGEWVAVSSENEATVTPSSADAETRLIKFFSQIVTAILTTAQNPAVIEEKWYQVDFLGKIKVPDTLIAGASQIIVQDSNNRVLGWKATGSTPRPNASGLVSTISQTKPKLDRHPRIFGTPRVGNTLEATTGTWRSPSMVNYRYQWLRCDLSTEKSKKKPKSCLAIKGSTNQTHALKKSDKGKFLVVRVSAVTSVGKSKAFSKSTKKIKKR